ncbi:MAG: hypothetical protein AAGB25_03310 [Pseudomonadota bacterium]
MGVSTRHILLGFAAAAALSGAAFAGGGGHKSPEPKHKGGCCHAPKHHTVTVPGVHTPSPHVVVHAPKTKIHTGGAAFGGVTILNTGVAVSGQSSVIVGGGGGYFGSPAPVAGSVVSNLTVDGGDYEMKTVTEHVPEHISECIDQVRHVEMLRPVQALCIDDKGTPHPASRVSAEDQVASDFSGELFRCMAGTSMQVTLGSYESGHADFSAAETFSCAKGEALVHTPGGQISCARQAPERNCNERSLLRRHGPGVKLVNMSRAETYCEPTTRTVMKTVTREVKVETPSTGGRLMLDGGVGQGVY